MNACSIKGTPYEAEYLNFLSPAAVIKVWTDNKEQPLDKIKVDNIVIDNPLFTELMAHPSIDGDRVKALKQIANTFFIDFTSRYSTNDSNRYTLEQVLDYEQLRARQIQQTAAAIRSSINTPSSMAINFTEATIDGEISPIRYTVEQAQEIYDTFQFLIGYGKNWTSVFNGFANRRNELLTRVAQGDAFENDLSQLINLEKIIQNFDMFIDWYSSKQGTVGIEYLEDKFGDSEDWKTKEKSQLERAGKDVIALVQALPAFRKVFSTEIDTKALDVEQTSIEVEGNLLGLPIASDFVSNWKLLSNALSGITTYTKMHAEIKTLAVQYPQFEYLLKELPDPKIKGSTKNIKVVVLTRSIVAILSNPEVTSSVLDITKKGDGKIATTRQIKGVNNKINLLAKYDAQYFSLKTSLKLIDDNGVPYLNLPALLQKHNYISTKILNNLTGDLRKILTDSDVASIIVLLQDLGLGLNNTDYMSAANMVATKEFIIANVKNKLAPILRKLINTATINSQLPTEDQIKISQVLSYISSQDARLFQGNGKQLTEKVARALRNTKNIEAFTGFLQKKSTELNPFIDYFAQFDVASRPTAYITAEKKTKFIRSQWFGLTQTTNAVNQAKNYEELISMPGFARFDYRKNPDMLGSIWLNRLFGLPLQKNNIGNKPLSSYTKQKDILGNPILINIEENGGLEVKNITSDTVGSHTTNLHPGDKILQDFISMFQSTVVENPRFGDKSSAFSTVFSNPILKDKLYIGLSLSKLNGKDTSTAIEPEMLVYFDNYLISEVTRILDIIELQDNVPTGTFYNNARNLFIFNDILPKSIIEQITQATTRDELIVGYKKAKALLPTALEDYFKTQGDILANNIINILSTSIDLQTGDSVSMSSRMTRVTGILSQLNMINPQLLDTSQRRGANLQINPLNLQYLTELYIKNGFIHNVEFLKFFIGDSSNFTKKEDYREIFKRMPLSSSPGTPVFWDSSLQEFFNEDTGQDALSIAYSGVENKFTEEVRTITYEDVNTFTSEDYETYKEAYDSGNWDELTQSEKSEFDAYTKKPKEGDGQAYITLDFYRNYLISIGRWDTDKQEKAYWKQVRFSQIKTLLKSNPTNSAELTKESLELSNSIGGGLFPPLKLGHLGPIVQDAKQTSLHKFSLLPLIPSVLKDNQLSQLLDIMYKQKVNYVTFKSGSKQSDFGVVAPFYQTVMREGIAYKEINQDIDEKNVTSLHIQNLREQQYQSPKFKKDSRLATQMMKLIFGDFFEFGEISTDFTAETQKFVKDSYSKFTSNLNNLVQFELVKLERKIGITKTDGQVTGIDQLKLAKFIAKEFDERDVSDALRQYIQVTEDGNFRYPLDASSNRSEIESLILNIFNNKVIAQKMFGESFIQAASSGFQTSRFANPTAEQLKEFGANNLQFYRQDPVTGKTLPMEVMIAFNFEKHGALLKLEFNGQPIGTLEKLNEILESNTVGAKAWKQRHQQKITMTGVRIPVQSFNSMEYVIIKKFLPESMGAVMILPPQIVVKSGGDYDIDKLTFFMTALDESGEVIKANFSVVDYESKLDEQAELKRDLAKLKTIRTQMRSEISSNPIYAQRQDIKDTITELYQEIDDQILELETLIIDESITEQDAVSLLDLGKDKRAIALKFAELTQLDRDNTFSALAVINAIRDDVKTIKKRIEVIDNFRKSLSNDLVETLQGILSLGELYDALVTPNNNNVLTQFVDPNKIVKITSTDVFNPLTSWRIYAENILSKDALGIDAKINTLQKEFQLAGLEFGSDYLNTYYLGANKNSSGAIMLGGKKDSLGENRISKVLSEFVNGHVDIANEDWIILLGLNEETSPLAHAMILNGTPIKDVLGFINSDIIKLARDLSNRADFHKQLGNVFVSKDSAILSVIKNITQKSTNTKLKEYIATVDRSLNTLAKASSSKLSGKQKVEIYVQEMLKVTSLNKHLVNFNPDAQLTPAEVELRDIAYLLQYGVVIAQQNAIRELTSIADFNTTSFRTSYATSEVITKQSKLGSYFNKSALDFMFTRSALAQFNVADSIQQIMEKIFELTDSVKFRETITKTLENQAVYKEDHRIRIIKSLKENAIFTHVQRTASDSRGNLMQYYRGKGGLMFISNPNNITKQFEVLLSNKDLMTNKVLHNILPDILPNGEIQFIVKGFIDKDDAAEYRKAFLEGLNSQVPAIKQFFTDLALGSYMQYGGHYNPQSVASIVPYEAYIEHTSKSYQELMAMSKSDPEKFDSYLTLVRTATAVFPNNLAPITTSMSFLSQIDNIQKYPKIGSAVMLKKLAALEAKVFGSAQVSLVTENIPIVQTTPTPTVPPTSVEGSVKKGVSEIFEFNPELTRVGTPEQYSIYLESIFPDSKVKDIVYHGTGNLEKVKAEGFSKSKLKTGEGTNLQGAGFYFAKFKQVLSSYAKGEKGGFVQAIVNLKNPLQERNFPEFLERELNEKHVSLSNVIEVGQKVDNWLNKNNKDGVIWNQVSSFKQGTVEQETVREKLFGTAYNKNEKTLDVEHYSVIESEQIHILGSKQDIQGFKEFVGKSSTSVKEGVSELFATEPSTSVREDISAQDIADINTTLDNFNEVDVTEQRLPDTKVSQPPVKSTQIDLFLSLDADAPKDKPDLGSIDFTDDRCEIT